jgi:hypothetical protein
MRIVYYLQMSNNPLPATPQGQMFSLEDRPDYMLEAFLDEQSLLVKPLVLRRLSLLTLLDLQSQIIEKQVVSPPTKKARTAGAEVTGESKVLADLLDLTEEKIQIAKQLQDIAFKQLDSLLEVEAALEAGVKREREENPPRPATKQYSVSWWIKSCAECYSSSLADR